MANGISGRDAGGNIITVASEQRTDSSLSLTNVQVQAAFIYSGTPGSTNKWIIDTDGAGLTIPQGHDASLRQYADVPARY
jgi:hypothetical protein